MSDQDRFREVFYEAIRLADVAQRTHFQMHPDSEGFRYWEAVAYYCWLNRRDLEDAETLRGLGSHIEGLGGVLPAAIRGHSATQPSDKDTITEVYHGDKGYPTHYRCTTCGSEFPVLGDTDRWAHCESSDREDAKQTPDLLPDE